MTQTEGTELTARERLRSETRPKHAELDALLGELRPFTSVERYAIYLLGMRELYARFGAALDRCAELSEQSGRQQEMIEAIDRDLAACERLTPTELPSNGSAGASPSRDSGLPDSAAWGAAYVLEGSAMGAQMLVRSARERLPAAVTIEFLQALAGSGVGRFKNFCAAMESADVDGDEAVAAAAAVFEHAIGWYRTRMNAAVLDAGEN